MEQRVSLITLGVRDLAQARAFYEELGWQTNAAPDDDNRGGNNHDDRSPATGRHDDNHRSAHSSCRDPQS